MWMVCDAYLRVNVIILFIGFPSFAMNELSVIFYKHVIHVRHVVDGVEPFHVKSMQNKDDPV